MKVLITKKRNTNKKKKVALDSFWLLFSYKKHNDNF